MQGPAVCGQSGRDCDVVTSPLNTLDSPSKNTKRKRLRATRRSTTNLPETMLTNAEMFFFVRRTRHTPVIHYGPRRLRCVGQGQPLLTGRGPCVAGPSAGTFHGRGIVCKRMTLFGTIYRDIPQLWAAADEHWEGLFWTTQVSEGPTATGTDGDVDRGDLLKQHRLLDILAGLALIMSYDFFTRPSKTLKIFSRDVIAFPARGYHSVCVIIALARDHEKRRMRRYIPGRLARPPARIRAGALDTSASLWLARPPVAVGVWSSWASNWLSNWPPHGHDWQLWKSRRTAPRRSQWRCIEEASGRARHSEERPVALRQNPCDARKKLANSLGKWHCLMPPPSTRLLWLWWFKASKSSCLTAVVDIRALRREINIERFQWGKGLVPSRASRFTQWHGVASMQPCQCPLWTFCFCPARERRWPFLQSALPKRSEIAVSPQLARADVCWQSENDVVIHGTAGRSGLAPGLWTSAIMMLMNRRYVYIDIYI